MSEATPVENLTPDEAAAELARLAALIAEADAAYYQEDAPALTDAEIAFAVSLEVDFHDVEWPLAFWNGHPFEPVEDGHHITTAVAAIAIGPTAQRLAVLAFSA